MLFLAGLFTLYFFSQSQRGFDDVHAALELANKGMDNVAEIFAVSRWPSKPDHHQPLLSASAAMHADAQHPHPEQGSNTFLTSAATDKESRRWRHHQTEGKVN
jgi:hypothetical protein